MFCRAKAIATAKRILAAPANLGGSVAGGGSILRDSPRPP
jgi:hypothetical protein